VERLGSQTLRTHVPPVCLDRSPRRELSTTGHGRTISALNDSLVPHGRLSTADWSLNCPTDALRKVACARSLDTRGSAVAAVCVHRPGGVTGSRPQGTDVVWW
jgi:hypothetical protein